MFPERFSFTSTLTMCCLTNNYSVGYISIDYFKRQGKSSIRPLKDFLGFAQLIIKLAVLFKPLKVFLVPSFLIMLSGLGYGIYQILTTSGLGEFPVLIFLTGLQIAFLGIIGELIVKNRSN